MTRDEIIDKANEREFTLKVGNTHLKAKLAGKQLDYPICYTIEGKELIECYINWEL